MTKNNLEDILENILFVLLILFIIFIGYQILRAIFGGSWTDEQIAIGLMTIVLSSFFVIVGYLINQARAIGKIESNISNLNERFKNMGKDLKEHLSLIKSKKRKKLRGKQ